MPPPIIADRFEVQRRIGAGGMGIVYRACDTTTGAVVAVKVVRADGPIDIGRFDREASALASLDHPSIVRYVSHGVMDDGSLFLAMEWLDGDSVGDRLAGPGFSVAESVAVARQVAEALGQAHAAGIVHRDIKPGNVLLHKGHPAQIKVIDFGIARFADAPRLTATGTTVGTPGYMSPEQARGITVLDARADVFALGCLLFECLTGRRAFTGEHVLAVHAKVVFSDPPLVRSLCPEAPPQLEILLGRMLAKDPAMRPADGSLVAAALAKLTDLPDAPRRPRVAAAAVTTFAGSRPLPRPVCIVVSGPASAADSQELDVIGETLLDGSTIAAFACVEGDDPATIAERAAQCALALRATRPDVPVIVASAGPDDDMDAVLDRAVRALSVEKLAARSWTDDQKTVAGAQIRIDSETTELLGDGYDTVEMRRAVYLRGLRHTDSGE